MIGIILCFVLGSWLSTVAPVFPDDALLLYGLGILGWLKCQGFVLVTKRKSFSVLAALMIGFFSGMHALLVWHERHQALMPQGKSRLLCGRPVQALRIDLPAQQWLFRLVSYRWYSWSRRYDQVIVHAYQKPLLSESKAYCLRVHRLKHRLTQWPNSKTLYWLTHGVLGAVQLERIQRISHLPESFFIAARRWVRQWAAHFDSPSTRHVLLALLLGDRSTLTREDWSLFSKTGTSHLVAVSGLHVMWVVLTISFLLSFVASFTPKLFLWLPRSSLSAVFEIVIGVLYGLLLYPSIPAYRALMMLFIHAFFRLLGERQSSGRVLFWVFSVMVISQPFSYLQASACLSYWAAYWLIASPRGRGEETVSAWLSSQWWMLLGLLPLTLFYFGQWYGISWFANLLAVPWMGLLVFPLCFLGLLLYAASPAFFSMAVPFFQAPIDALLVCLSKLSRHPIVSVSTACVDLLVLIFALFLLYCYRLRMIRLAAVTGLIPIVMLCVSGVSYPVSRLAWYPVGRGEGVLYRRHGESWLYLSGVAPGVYQYALGREALRSHWGVISHCLSADKGIVFPKGLCRKVETLVGKGVIFEAKGFLLSKMRSSDLVDCTATSQTVVLLSGGGRHASHVIRVGWCQQGGRGRYQVHWRRSDSLGREGRHYWLFPWGELSVINGLPKM